MVEEIKKKLKEALNVPDAKFEFKFQGNVLEDNMTAAECGLVPNCTIAAKILHIN